MIDITMIKGLRMDLSNLVDGQNLLENKNKYKKIFFFRICGTGMGACACILKEAGFEVTGADSSFSPPMSTYLETTGIELYDLAKIDTVFLQQFDLIVVGNSVARNSEHAKMIEGCGVAFTSFPAILGAYVLKDREVIGIAGTHGKTTTTYFLTQILEKLGEKPGYFVGGIIENRPPSQLGESKYFVIESDEYDSAYFQKFSKFQLYELNHMILTSLEFDHADIYQNVEEIEEQFERVLLNMDGQVVANNTYSSIIKLQHELKINWHMYSEMSDFGPFAIEESPSLTQFRINWNKEEYVFKTNVIGKHNILNISSCIFMLLHLGFEISKLKNVIETLEMVKRRQEVRGNYHGAIVIDDFAHHPRAIELTIDAIKNRYPNNELITIFEPVSATARSDYFQDEFANSLMKSNKVIIAKSPIQTTVRDRKNLDCDKLVADISDSGIEAYCANSLDKLIAKIDEWVSDQKILLILSNRTCIGLWESDFVKQLV